MYGTFSIICDEFQKCKTLFKIFLIFMSFYEKHGFIKNGFRKNYYRNPNDNGVLMMKKIGDKYAYTGN